MLEFIRGVIAGSNIERDVLNPYGVIWDLFVNRIKWDCNPNSWASRRHLASVKNSHLGEKGVVMCNGPSLLKCDLEPLSEIYTFGLNKINLLFGRTSFRPQSIVAVNPYVIQQNSSFYNETQIDLYLDYRMSKYIKKRKNVHFLHTLTNVTQVATNCEMSMLQGATVTCVALQLALHMGFSEIGLIGCDHSFATSGEANKTVFSGSVDRDHFDPNYFSGGVPWQLPDLKSSEYYYELCRRRFEALGRKVYNCTEGGRLEVFERKPLHSFLADLPTKPKKHLR